MTVISYHSTLISHNVSNAETPRLTTSSQILVSREIADSGSTAIAPRLPAGSIPIASLLGSRTQHITTLGDNMGSTPEDSVVGVAPREAKMDNTPSNGGIDTASATGNKNELQRTVTSQSSIGQGRKPDNQVVSKKSFGIDSIISKTDERGRSLNRALTYQDPFTLRKTKARGGTQDTAIDLEPSSIAKSISRSHTFFEDPSDPSALLDDSLMEPCPYIPLGSSVSEILDPCYNLSSRSIQEGHFPTRLITTIQDTTPPYSAGEHSYTLDTEYVSLSSSASRLPTEILQQIFYILAPVDFNSARHVCRSWLIGSLNESLLGEMLERGGFSAMIRHQVYSVPAINARVSSEWQLSKLLARECALGPDWAGNGLSVRSEDNKSESSKQSAFTNAAVIDFSELSTLDQPSRIIGSIFTVSTCGRFLMVANGCLVYVYQLDQTNFSVTKEAEYQGSYLKPLTCIICPNRVLACSMDNSSSRNAIAILLDGRMGIVCDLTSLKIPVSADELNSLADQKHQDLQKNDILSRTSPCDHLSPILPSLSEDSRWSSTVPSLASPRGIATKDTWLSSVSDAGADAISTEDWEKDNLEERGAPPSQKAPFMTSVSIENGARSLYRNLCSDDDPPRSVAICPQRRCVAFGCSSGIELHWVDALTGQDLNRWFPLTVPSDFLFFLPSRMSVDSAKKLTLISSAAKPSEKSSIALRNLGSRSQSSPFWGRCGWPRVLGYPYDNRESAGKPACSDRTRTADVNVGAGGYDRSLEYDHFCAIPLSDGYHVLFTDPPTGRLCLGSDAPVGGPTKLLRKIWFEEPEGQGSPDVYVGGSDLSCGVRVVAAYGDSIWLFSVPPDILTANHCSNYGLNASIWAKSKPRRKEQNTKWTDWWPHYGFQEWLAYSSNGTPGWRTQGAWPVKIRGQELGNCPGVVDLAVAPGPSMTVWAFSSKGVTKVWKLDTGEREAVAKIWVMQDGSIRQIDIEGDTEMSGCHSVPEAVPPLFHSRLNTFDGTYSLEPFRDHVSDHAECTTKRRYKTRYDTEGDVEMNESWIPFLPYGRSSSSEKDVFRGCIRPTVDEATHLAHCECGKAEADLIARMEIEIR